MGTTLIAGSLTFLITLWGRKNFSSTFLHSVAEGAVNYIDKRQSNKRKKTDLIDSFLPYLFRIL